MAGAHQQHPDQTILLDGVITDLFYNHSRPPVFAPWASTRSISHRAATAALRSHIDWGDAVEFILPAEIAARALEQQQLVVYDVRGPRLRNITAQYTATLHPAEMPRLVDASKPLEGYLLGPEWYGIDGDHRWMPKRATLRIGGPRAPGQKLYLHGYCQIGTIRPGSAAGQPSAINGLPLATAVIPRAEMGSISRLHSRIPSLGCRNAGSGGGGPHLPPGERCSRLGLGVRHF